MKLSFAKYEGLGNDFLVIDGPPIEPQQAVRLCDRHRGVGADGVLTVDGQSMAVVNSNGSVPEMCGNGLRCVALHLTRRGVVPEGERFEVATDAGAHGCRVEGSMVSVDLSPPSFVPGDLPVLAEGPMIDALFEVDGATLHATALSLGNPHVVFFDDVGEVRRQLGPRIGADPRFPSGVNVGFARAESTGVITLHVFERGAGWTQACGTGACAAAVAAVETGRRARQQPVMVLLPGGALHIVVGSPKATIQMKGPAHHVFDGTVDLEPPRET